MRDSRSVTRIAVTVESDYPLGAQARGVSRLARAVRLARCGRSLTGNRRRRPAERDHPRDRRLDASLSLPHARDHAAAAAHRLERGDSLPPDAGAVRVLLRHRPPAHLHRVRSSGERSNFPSLARSAGRCGLLAISIGGEIVKRPYINVGFTSWVCMLRSPRRRRAGMIRRMGGKRWQALHRLIYAAAVAGVLHYWWLVKADVREPAALRRRGRRAALVRVVVGRSGRRLSGPRRRKSNAACR